MNENEAVTSARQWLDLPEISFPTIKSADEKGSIYIVQKVGFLALTLDQCAKENIFADAGPGGRCLLPTTIIEFAGSRQLCRLPLSLAPWAFDCIAHVRGGTVQLPASAEFGKLNGREFAEWV